MNEMNVGFVSLAVVACAVALGTATWAVKTAGVDTNQAETNHIQACAKNGGSYTSDGRGNSQCIQSCQGFK